ncbi:DUF4114 domain-containing protein [bacterium]|nr:DUF4114 domain-containing protein [bacterium]
MPRQLKLFALLALALVPAFASAFPVTWGTSWDNVSLQDVLDAEYGPGAIDAATGYEGYLPGDGDPAYWQDFAIDGLIVREIAGFSPRNTLGWYAETLGGPPVIDGIDDGVVFTGAMGEGAATLVTFPGGLTSFGFYLNPNGTQDGGANAPEPELFFTNRFYNDLGPDGSGSPHAPFDGDPQCLVYNITALKGGVPTFVLAWEDLDYGGPITPNYQWSATDNDFQDLVVEIQALSPVAVESESWGSVKSLFR